MSHILFLFFLFLRCCSFEKIVHPFHHPSFIDNYQALIFYCFYNKCLYFFQVTETMLAKSNYLNKKKQKLFSVNIILNFDYLPKCQLFRSNYIGRQHCTALLPPKLTSHARLSTQRFCRTFSNCESIK